MGSVRIVINDFVFRGSDPTSRTVTFSGVAHPHNDEPALFFISIEAEGLTARCSVESTIEDAGLSQAPIIMVPEARQEYVHLSALLVELSGTAPWKGTYEWRIYTDELMLTLTSDDLGHVDIEFKIQPDPWNRTWTASCTLTYDLGELAQLGKDLGAWFRNSRPE